MSLTLSKSSIDFIIEQEVTSQDYYNKHLTKLTWPGAYSGITGGIGYDFGQTSQERIKDDWAMELNANNIALLLEVSGIIGEPANTLLKQKTELQSIVISYHSAKRVFTHCTLPRFCRAALKIYKGLESLAPDAVGGIVSMVFNRGNSLTDNPKCPELQTRLEMRNIVPLIASKDYSGIAYQVNISKRLWLNKGLNGLCLRREEESRLIHNADHKYEPDELVEIVF